MTNLAGKGPWRNKANSRQGRVGRGSGTGAWGAVQTNPICPGLTRAGPAVLLPPGTSAQNEANLSQAGWRRCGRPGSPRLPPLGTNVRNEPNFYADRDGQGPGWLPVAPAGPIRAKQSQFAPGRPERAPPARPAGLPPLGTSVQNEANLPPSGRGGGCGTHRCMPATPVPAAPPLAGCLEGGSRLQCLCLRYYDT